MRFYYLRGEIVNRLPVLAIQCLPHAIHEFAAHAALVLGLHLEAGAQHGGFMVHLVQPGDFQVAFYLVAVGVVRAPLAADAAHGLQDLGSEMPREVRKACMGILSCQLNRLATWLELQPVEAQWRDVDVACASGNGQPGMDIPDFMVSSQVD